jgi:hypothetical protein
LMESLTATDRVTCEHIPAPFLPPVAWTPEKDTTADEEAFLAYLMTA